MRESAQYTVADKQTVIVRIQVALSSAVGQDQNRLLSLHLFYMEALFGYFPSCDWLQFFYFASRELEPGNLICEEIKIASHEKDVDGAVLQKALVVLIFFMVFQSSDLWHTAVAVNTIRFVRTHKFYSPGHGIRPLVVDQTFYLSAEIELFLVEVLRNK